MTVTRLISIACSLAFLLNSCNKSSKQSGEAPATTDTSTSTTTTSDSDDSTSDSSTSSSVDPDVWLQGYYTGYNGNDKFSLYLPSFREMSIDDPSIASIESQSVTLSAETIDALVAEQKAKNENFDDTRIREILSRPRTVYKLTPLKAGQTKLRTKAGGKGPGGGVWNQGQAVVLVVTKYSQDLVALGKSRYLQDGEDNKRSCASCHETGANNAPPHELGDIMSIPDASAEQWISTGKLSGRTASIPHAWEFASDQEKLGVVAYLRTLQTTDLETLTKLEFENQLANLPAPPPGTGTSTTPTTSTSSGD